MSNEVVDRRPLRAAFCTAYGTVAVLGKVTVIVRDGARQDEVADDAQD